MNFDKMKSCKYPSNPSKIVQLSSLGQILASMTRVTSSFSLIHFNATCIFLFFRHDFPLFQLLYWLQGYALFSVCMYNVFSSRKFPLMFLVQGIFLVSNKVSHFFITLNVFISKYPSFPWTSVYQRIDHH